VTLPAGLVQFPLQHSKFVEQISPGCVQKDTALEQAPSLQKFEQQSEWWEQGLFAVRHVCPTLTFWQRLFVQIPLQQSPGMPQVPGVGLSGTHCLSAQTLPMHEPVQHSFGVVHATPGSLQVLVFVAQRPLVASQFAEQQSVLLVQP
jgi:hypothetical protein